MSSRAKIAIVAAVVVAIAATSWIVRAVQANEAPPWRLTEEQQAAKCLDGYAELNLPENAKPVERMLLRKNGGWIRILVSEPDNWATACQGGPDNLTGNFGTRMESGPADKLRFFGGYDSVVKAHLLLGHMPAGGAFIEARLANGQVVPGDHDGNVFVIWAPGGLAVDGAQVTVFTQDRDILVTAPAPTE